MIDFKIVCCCCCAFAVVVTVLQPTICMEKDTLNIDVDLHAIGFENAVSLIIKNHASKPMMQISGYFWVLQVKTALHCTALSIDP